MCRHYQLTFSRNQTGKVQRAICRSDTISWSLWSCLALQAAASFRQCRKGNPSWVIKMRSYPVYSSYYKLVAGLWLVVSCALDWAIFWSLYSVHVLIFCYSSPKEITGIIHCDYLSQVIWLREKTKGDTRNRKLLPVTWYIARTHFKLTVSVWRTVTKNKSPTLTWHLHWKKKNYPPEDALFKIPTQSLFYVLGNSYYQSYFR